MRILFFGCDIADHDLVTVNSAGKGEQFSAPWNGKLANVGDPEKDGAPFSDVRPLLALFQGREQPSGWLLEGRDLKIGPSMVMYRGDGQTATVAMDRSFPIPTKTPEMYELRLRTYRDRWVNAVDPYIAWMERDAGFVPLEKKSPSWVKEIKNQAYINVGDLAGLDALAKRVDPKKTLVGAQWGFRRYADPTHCPNYELSDLARKWFEHARELGFHIGGRYSTFAVSPDDPELLERFRPGFAVVGTDKDGKTLYSKLPPNPSPLVYFYYCSLAHKPFRDYLVQQIRHTVEAGADLIYLDEASWPCGAMVVDGVNAVEGVLLLEKEILAAYPNVALETEQFNPMSSRHASFGLNQMYAGHPLGGYIFHRFIHIVPEGIVGSPTQDAFLEAFQSYGYYLPNATSEETWLEVAKAFEDYDLAPDGRMTDPVRRTYTGDPSGGLIPTTQPQTSEPVKLFGYRGRNEITAFFERHPTKRGLVVYESGAEPKWFGARVHGVNKWAGPGVLKEWMPGVETEVEWLMYDGNTQIGLEPGKAYRLDQTATLPPERFHVTGIPGDFALFDRQPGWARAQDVARDGSFYKVVFTGHGDMRMHVPDGVMVFLDGKPVAVDRQAKSAQVQVEATKDKPGVLLAFVGSDKQLTGKLTDLPWQTSPKQRPGMVRQEAATPPNSFISGISGIMFVNGTLPQASGLHLRGTFKVSEETHVANSCEGVIRINGNQIVRVPMGERPFKAQPFDADLGAYVGQQVLIEFITDGLMLAAPAQIEWQDPQIVSGS